MTDGVFNLYVAFWLCSSSFYDTPKPSSVCSKITSIFSKCLFERFVRYLVFRYLWFGFPCMLTFPRCSFDVKHTITILTSSTLLATCLNLVRCRGYLLNNRTKGKHSICAKPVGFRTEFSSCCCMVVQLY